MVKKRQRNNTRMESQQEESTTTNSINNDGGEIIDEKKNENSSDEMQQRESSSVVEDKQQQSTVSSEGLLEEKEESVTNEEINQEKSSEYKNGIINEETLPQDSSSLVSSPLTITEGTEEELIAFSPIALSAIASNDDSSSAFAETLIGQFKDILNSAAKVGYENEGEGAGEESMIPVEFVEKIHTPSISSEKEATTTKTAPSTSEELDKQQQQQVKQVNVFQIGKQHRRSMRRSSTFIESFKRVSQAFKTTDQKSDECEHDQETSTATELQPKKPKYAFSCSSSEYVSNHLLVQLFLSSTDDLTVFLDLAKFKFIGHLKKKRFLLCNSLYKKKTFGLTSDCFIEYSSVCQYARRKTISNNSSAIAKYCNENDPNGLNYYQPIKQDKMLSVISARKFIKLSEISDICLLQEGNYFDEKSGMNKTIPQWISVTSGTWLDFHHAPSNISAIRLPLFERKSKEVINFAFKLVTDTGKVYLYRAEDSLVLCKWLVALVNRWIAVKGRAAIDADYGRPGLIKVTNISMQTFKDK